MSAFIINGGKPLIGKIKAQGSKNSAVAVLIASIITNGISVIKNVPDISDVRACLELLECLGIKTDFSSGCVTVDTSFIHKSELPSETVKKMRASSYLIGAELARFGECSLPDSGGCNFGSRPINYHINAMRSLGAEYGDNKLFSEGLTGNTVVLPYPSVGATVNSIIAASKASGVTVIKNAAREPHIVDIADYLNSCGAEIKGAGSRCIKIKGKKNIGGGKITITPDMIESGTYLIYGLMTNGCITVQDTAPKQLGALLNVFREMNARVCVKESSVSVMTSKLRSANVTTAPYPEFPTDLQPQMASLFGTVKGKSEINENVFSDRFGYISSLAPFGLNYSTIGRTLSVNGCRYQAAETFATDLRGGAAAVGAALSAKGKSTVKNADFILRGYSDFAEKLRSLGADIIYIAE